MPDDRRLPALGSHGSQGQVTLSHREFCPKASHHDEVLRIFSRCFKLFWMTLKRLFATRQQVFHNGFALVECMVIS